MRIITVALMICIVGVLSYIALWIVEYRALTQHAYALVEKEQRIASSTLAYFYELSTHSLPERTALPSWADSIVVTITEDNLNERRMYPKEKGDAFRIVVLGDSWVFGRFVSTQDNTVEQLEDLFARFCTNPVEVINLGVPGYDIEYAVERYRIRGVAYDPDMALFLFNANDFNEWNQFLETRMREYARKYRIPFTTESSGVDVWLDAFRDQMKEIGSERVLTIQMDALTRLRALFTRQLVLVAYPNMGLDEQIVPALATFANQSRAELYISEKFLNDEERLPDGHPNKDGHTLLARDLFSYLTTKQFVECR